jgi:hypothetical protein
MMAGGLLAQYRAAYERPHEPVIRVEVWDNTEQLDEITITGGSVECSLNSQVTRRGSITVDPVLMPKRPTDLLAPFGNRLKIYRGIRISSSVDMMFPVFSGLITKAERKPRGIATITFVDRAAEVDENDFEAAEETRAGANLVDEIVRLIREGVPDAEFGEHDAIAVPAAAQVFDDSRAQACDQLADAAGAFWYALPDGRFVVRRVPWTYHPQQQGGIILGPYDRIEPVREYYARGYDDSNGTVLDYGESMSRETVYNIVVGEADQPNADSPQRAVVRDTDPTSPTYVNGKFGRRVLTAELPSASTNAVVRHGASTLLRRARASAEVMPLEMIPDAALELGDLIELRNLPTRDRAIWRVVSEFTIPLTPEGSMTASCRPLVLADGTVVDEVSG